MEAIVAAGVVSVGGSVGEMVVRKESGERWRGQELYK